MARFDVSGTAKIREWTPGIEKQRIEKQRSKNRDRPTTRGMIRSGRVGSCSYPVVWSRFLYANRYPLRSKTRSLLPFQPPDPLLPAFDRLPHGRRSRAGLADSFSFLPGLHHVEPELAHAHDRD